MNKNESVSKIKHMEHTEPFIKASIVRFLKDNESPTNSDIKYFAKTNKIDIEKVEEFIYKIASEHARKHMK